MFRYSSQIKVYTLEGNNRHWAKDALGGKAKLSLPHLLIVLGHISGTLGRVRRNRCCCICPRSLRLLAKEVAAAAALHFFPFWRKSCLLAAAELQIPPLKLQMRTAKAMKGFAEEEEKKKRVYL